MSEPVFFQRGRGLALGEIVALTGAVVRGDPALDRRLNNIAPLDRAGPDDLTFIDSAKFIGQLAALRAGACLTTVRFATDVPDPVIALTIADPYRAFVTVAEALFPAADRPSSLFDGQAGAEDAFVHPSARLESGVVIDPGAVIGPRTEIGAATVIGPAAVIGPDVRIGRDCAVGPGASVTHALIGDRVILHGGCRIGQDGFGYLPGPQGHRKIPQVGRVIVQNDVEIGANATIDRGGIRDTVIGEGTKIDNLVQIAHNVTVGRHCLFAALVGISGSSTIGDYTMLGGQVGIADNVTIGEGVRLAARSAVFSDVPAGARWAGSPARPVREWMRGEVWLKRMARRGAGKEIDV
ncbi:MAG: UDP-3-O-(3-hydroxymyristoyl)glucosamine N-acyltransferase [Pseudolabrys sp.]